MFHAYRYRLGTREYSRRRERGKFAIQICLWHRSTTKKFDNLSKHACCQTESSRKDVLLNCTMLYTCLVSFEVLLFSNANWIVFSLQKVQGFGAPMLIFKPRAFTFLVSHECKDSGDENTSSFGTWTSFLGWPRLPPEVVLARLNFSACGPKNVLLHGKNQVGCALYYWPGSQNLGLPYSK